MPHFSLFGHRLPVFGAHFAGQNYRKTKENLFRRKVCRCHYPKKPYISSSGGIRHKPSPRRPRRSWGEGSTLILSSFPATREARATATTFAPASPIIVKSTPTPGNPILDLPHIFLLQELLQESCSLQSPLSLRSSIFHNLSFVPSNSNSVDRAPAHPQIGGMCNGHVFYGFTLFGPTDSSIPCIV